jgi:exonuclease SbcC
MRILEIRLENLNSLVGRWVIDFTHPAFESDGIFAIVGPTGAGKSTILDAICLALYGRTPRLKKISKGDNELMSRLTGTASAEVTFVTAKGRYRCHWSQRRAKNGALQAPKHEIVDADSGKVLANRIQDVALRIEAATGMDFKRFTRSMLLAQGEFAAFLDAPPDERAPILEQITGTEIYSRMSIAAHERHARERKTLELLEAECASIPRMGEEEEQALLQALMQKTGEESALQGEIAELTLLARWRENIDALTEALRELVRQGEALELRARAFAPEQEKLDFANRALQLAGDAARLTALLESDAAERAALDAACRMQPERKAALEAARRAEESASAAWEARRSEWQAALPVLEKARELDLKLAGKAVAHAALAARIAQGKARLAALDVEADRDRVSRATHAAALAEHTRRLEENAADASLVEELAGLKRRFETLRALALQEEARGRALDEARQSEQVARQRREAAELLHTRAQAHRRIQAEALAEQEKRLAEALEARDVAAWRKEAGVAAARREALAAALRTGALLCAAKASLALCAEQEKTLREEEAALRQTFARECEHQAQAETQLRLTETQFFLLQKIAHYEQARHALQDGEPCPLCGAREHPFAQGNLPLPDAARQEMDAARQKKTACDERITALKIEAGRIARDLERLALQRQETERAGENSRAAFAASCASLLPAGSAAAQAPDLDPAAAIPELERLEAEDARHIARCEAILGAAETLLCAREAARETLARADAARAQAEREALHALHGHENARTHQATLTAEAMSAGQRVAEAVAALRREIAPYGLERALDEATGRNAAPLPLAAALESLLATLEARRQEWLAHRSGKASKTEEIAALDLIIARRAGQIEVSTAELRQHEQDLQGLAAEKAALLTMRETLFGTRDPDAEAKRLVQAQEIAEREREAARRNLAAALQAQEALDANVRELEQGIALRAPQLALAQSAFAARLAANGFADLAHYRAACLPEAEYQALAQRAQALAGEKAALAAREAEKRRLLAQEADRALTPRTLADLKAELAGKIQAQHEAQRQIGALRQRQEHAAAMRRAFETRSMAREAQTRESARWERLHALIGSSDGKKYRNFAQGLTFERVIAHANRQLIKMTDRYLLVQSGRHSLEPDIMDCYQAGEIRSTKTLSGGERFIVSLALALGLSTMVSDKVRVDSLFLDEGFGTLDDTALDTALDTLIGLRREGKLIGIISHVPALRERINTRIRVIPRTGGRSGLSGPGVRDR